MIKRSVWGVGCHFKDWTWPGRNTHSDSLFYLHVTTLSIYEWEGREGYGGNEENRKDITTHSFFRLMMYIIQPNKL